MKTGKGGQLAKRRGNIFGKVGIIVIIIMVGMSIMGVAHGAWKSAVQISATIVTGDWGVGLIVTSSSPGIGTSTVSVDDLTVTLDIELSEVPEGNYYVDFVIGNTGSIPIKIQNIGYSTIPTGVTGITNSIVVGLQLEGSGTQDGTVTFTVEPPPPDTVVSGSFQISFTGIEWNQYVP